MSIHRPIKPFFGDQSYKVILDDLSQNKRKAKAHNLLFLNLTQIIHSHMCNVPRCEGFFSDGNFNHSCYKNHVSRMNQISVKNLERYFTCIGEVFRKQEKNNIAFCYKKAAELLKVLVLVYKERESSGILLPHHMKKGREDDLNILCLFSAQYSVETSVNIIKKLIKLAYNLYVVPCQTKNAIKIIADLVGHGSGYKRGKSIIATTLNSRNVEYVTYHKDTPSQVPEDLAKGREVINKALDTIRKGPMTNVILQTSDFVYIIINRDKNGHINVPKIIVTCTEKGKTQKITQ